MKLFMKRMVRIVSVAVALTAAAIPAQSFNVTVGASCLFLDAAAAARARITGPLNMSSTDFAISKFDNGIVKAFEKAWERSGNGTSSFEGVVLVLRMADGSFSGRDMGATNEFRRFTFAWHPAAIAIVHTHPNATDPKPCGDDIVAADKYGVPIFTITSRGMYVYDPGTRKTSKVMKDLDWLDQANWSRGLLGKR
jgi:hypothetical protein